MDSGVISRMKDLTKAHGGMLTPRAVVDDAQQKDSPLHGFFDWNNRSAADKWRLEQARDLIRSVRVIIDEENIEIAGIGYVQDPDKGKGDQGYIPVATLRDDKEKARRALESELCRAESAMHRAREVARSLGLEHEVDSLLAHIRGVRSAA